MKKVYETYGHAKCHIRYHFIFSTKYRRSCLNGIEDELRRVFDEIAEKGDFKILRVGVDKNHVHLFVKSRPSVSIFRIVRILKQVSTRRMWQRCPDVLSKYYYGKRCLWSSGYFCSTVGEMSEDTIIRYIENQG